MKAVCYSLFTIFFLLPYWTVTHATEQPGQAELTLAIVQEKIETVKNKSNLDEDLKVRILNAYYATEDNLEEWLLLEQQIKEAQTQLQKLPAKIKQLEKRIAQAEQQLKNKKQERFSLYPTDELEQRRIIEKSKLKELEATISNLQIQLDDQLKRPQMLREKIAAVQSELTDKQQKQTSLATAVPNKQELEARQIQLESRIRILNAMLNKLDQENIAYPLSVQAKKLEVQLLNLQREQLAALIKGIDDFLIERWEQEIDKTQLELIKAQKEAADKHPVIQTATQENINYNQLLQETNKNLEHYLNKKIVIESQFKQLEKDFHSAEQKISLAGLSPALGNLLREQRRNLPLLKDYQSMFDRIQMEIAQAGLKLFQLEEVQKSLEDMNQNLKLRMEKTVPADLEENEKLKIRTELRLLLNNQKDLVIKLSSVYSNYSRTLADVDFSLQQLVTLGGKYSHYLDQRLLWVPSAPVIDKRYLIDIFHSILWFGSKAHWQQFGVDIKNSVQSSPLLALMGFIMVFLQYSFRGRIRKALHEQLKKSSKLYSDRFVYTFYSLGYVFLLALPVPLLMAWLSGLLQVNAQSSEFSLSVAGALFVSAVSLLIMQFFYQLFKPNGFVQTLFGWQETNLQLLYTQIKWLRLVIIPSVFIIALFSDEAYLEHSYSLGRVALMVVMLALSYMFHRFAHPVSGLAKDFYQAHPTSWLSRLRYIWYGVLVLIPLTIIGFAMAGYYQSALELQHKLIILLRLIFFSVLLHEVVMRGMVLANRQLALQNARQKRKLQELAENKEKAGVVAVNLEEELLLDIPKINAQTQKLLAATIIAILLIGSWLALQDILPALSIFEQVVLWQHMDVSTGQEVLQPITLVNVIVCFVYMILMFVFVNNFPGLIDLLFVGRFSMVAGSRYALIQLTRYTVITLTFIAIVNELGGSWSQVQWLVAALGVGLGFGLQEIFANLVSGIILLFERPIRVGDTVTVGDVSGQVTHIQMRATTIIDWDQKELIVPNKTFITERLINWSLSDTVTRVVIPVGVSYDSDDELVQKILEQVVAEAPLVLNEPAPSVYFLGFGDSSLDYNVRVFVRELNDRLPVTADIHKRIRCAFKEHNIEIPFPQRDLHFRSSDIVGESL